MGLWALLSLVDECERKRMSSGIVCRSSVDEGSGRDGRGAVAASSPSLVAKGGSRYRNSLASQPIVAMRMPSISAPRSQMALLTQYFLWSWR